MLVGLPSIDLVRKTSCIVSLSDLASLERSVLRFDRLEIWGKDKEIAEQDCDQVIVLPNITYM